MEFQGTLNKQNSIEKNEKSIEKKLKRLHTS